MKSLIALMLMVMCAAPLMAQSETGTLEHGNRQRTYRLYIPSSYDGSQPFPLVVALHPSGGTARTMASGTGFDVIAEREGFLALYPEGPFGYWDYGFGLPEWERVTDDLDDPGFLVALLDEIQATYNVDSARIYAVGFSNGARMTYRFACDHPGEIAAIAAVAATISDEVTNACPADAQPSVLFMHGTDDLVIPWRGKPLSLNGAFISNALSAPQTAQFWADQAGCGEATTQDEIGVNAEGTVQMLRDVYADCEGEQEVHFYRVEGGGHAWQFLPQVNTAEVVWEFFESHAKEE